MLKVIYITGYGRSGTTILDMVLGQHPQIFGIGELGTMCRHVWERDEYCACGARVSECDFWSAVMRGWIADGHSVAEYAALQGRVEPLISFSRGRNNAALARYLEETEALFARIADRAGATTLVDSSKMPGRGLALSKSRNIDLRVVHVVRDGRAVAHSMTRAIEVDVAKGLQKPLKSRPGYRTALRWRLYNHYAERLGAAVGAPNYVRIRYEDFVGDPCDALDRIAQAADIEVAELKAGLAARQPIEADHQMAGSRIRLSGPMTLRKDVQWEREISGTTLAQVRRFAGSQLRKYGYA